MTQIAFYCKGRPQGADIAQFSLDQGRIFIGYPPWRRGAELDLRSVGRSIVDVLNEDPTTAYPIKHRKQFTKNQNMVREIHGAEEAYVFMPRPAEGVCHVGRVTGDFRVENRPSWVKDYLALREKQELDVEDGYESHVGDVVQCWPVEFGPPVPFPLIPGWIRYQIMGRQTAAVIRDVVAGMGEDPVGSVARRMHQGAWAPTLELTLDRDEVERRLIRWLTPTAFEHLAVSLLQLERPDERWMQVGGSGDGGADGLGLKDGQVRTVVQCKWKYDGSLEELAGWLKKGDVTVLAASLIHDEDVDRGIVLDRSWFVERVLRHHERLPVARGLGIG